MRPLYILAMSFIMVSCASKAPTDPRIAETRSAVSQERTSFDEYTRYQGPKHPLSKMDGFTLIRSWRKELDDVPTHQLYVHVTSSDITKDFLSASMKGGKVIEIKTVDQGQTCQNPQSPQTCQNFEDIAVYIKDGYLKKMAINGGLQIRFNAKRGDDLVVTIPEWYLQGYLAAL